MAEKKVTVTGNAKVFFARREIASEVSLSSAGNGKFLVWTNPDKENERDALEKAAFWMDAKGDQPPWVTALSVSTSGWTETRGIQLAGNRKTLVSISALSKGLKVSGNARAIIYDDTNSIAVLRAKELLAKKKDWGSYGIDGYTPSEEKRRQDPPTPSGDFTGPSRKTNAGAAAAAAIVFGGGF